MSDMFSVSQRNYWYHGVVVFGMVIDVLLLVFI